MNFPSSQKRKEIEREWKNTISLEGMHAYQLASSCRLERNNKPENIEILGDEIDFQTGICQWSVPVGGELG